MTPLARFAPSGPVTQPPSTVHWGYCDPTVSTVPEAQRMEAFHTTMHMLHQRLELLINLPGGKLEKAALQSAALELAAH